MKIDELEYRVYKDEKSGISIIVDPYIKSTPKKEYELLSEKINKSVSSEIVEFYSKFRGRTIATYIENDLISLCQGGSVIGWLKDIVSGTHYGGKIRKKGKLHEGILWTEGYDEEELIAILEKNYFIFDYIDPTSRTYVLIDFISFDEPRLVLYKYAHRFYPLKLSVREYIDYSLKYAAVFLWQNEFIDIEKVSAKDLNALKNERDALFFNAFKAVLPEIDNLYTNNGFQVTLTENIRNRAWLMRFKLQLKSLQDTIGEAGTFQLNHKSNPEVIVPSGSILNPLTIQLVEQEIGRKLPDEMVAFYCQVNGIDLEWELNDVSIDGYRPFAKFKLVPFYQIFEVDKILIDKQYKHKILVDYLAGPETDDETLAFAGKCRAIFHSEFTQVVINIEEEDFPLYMLISGKFYPLNKKFTEFVEALLTCMGMEYFPRYLGESPIYTNESNSSFPFTQFMKKMFPGQKMFREI